MFCAEFSILATTHGKCLVEGERREREGGRGQGGDDGKSIGTYAIIASNLVPYEL